MSLYERLTKIGTLSEPKGVPNPVFSLPATVNWMRALSMIVEEQGINSDYSNEFYSQVAKKNWSVHQVNTTLEQLLFALHQCSALQALRKIPHRSDIVRVGIVCWYYGIYAAASAMVVAKDGSFQDNHKATLKVWNRQIAVNNLISYPFDFHITTLIEKDANKELKTLLKTDKFNLARKKPPQSFDQAYAACHAYLSGNVTWWRSEAKKKLLASPKFKYKDFKCKEARKQRDTLLKNKAVGFLHQAFRYRGKANYREALFLGFRIHAEKILDTYIDDLSKVLDAFVCQAGIFCSRRLGKSIWNEFITDLENSHSFSLAPTKIWGTNN